MKNQHFFSWSCCYLGVLSKWIFTLSVRVHAWWMLRWTAFVSVLGKKKLPTDIKSKQRPRPTELVRYQFEWLWPACIPKCLPSVKQTLYQMLAKELVSVFSTSVLIMSFAIIYNPVETVWLFSCERSEDAPLLWMGFCMTGLKYFNAMPGFIINDSPNANTTSRPMLRDSSERCCCSEAEAEARGRLGEGMHSLWRWMCFCFNSTLSFARHCSL